MTPFSRRRDSSTPRDWVRQVALAAVADAGIEMSEVDLRTRTQSAEQNEAEIRKERQKMMTPERQAEVKKQEEKEKAAEKKKPSLYRKGEKEQKKQHRRENSPGGGLENMIAYVDKFGNITSEPPAEDVAITRGE